MSLDNLARVSSPHTVNKLCTSRLTGAQLHIRLLNGAGHTTEHTNTENAGACLQAKPGPVKIESMSLYSSNSHTSSTTLLGDGLHVGVGYHS